MQIGEEAARQAAQDHKARVLLLAADAGDNTALRIKRLESDRLPVLVLPDGKAALGAALGFTDVAVAAVCDLGFAASLAEKLAAQNEQAQPAAAALRARQAKAMRRKTDTKKHGKKSTRHKTCV